MKPLFSRISFLALLSCCSFYAQAKERLWPTAIYCGDCVAATVSVQKSTRDRKLDHDYCLKHLKGDVKKLTACEQASAAQQEIPFFTDRCGSPDDPYFIGINGKEYSLHRTKAAWNEELYLTGSFEGEGLKIEIKPIKLSRKYYDDEMQKSEETVTSVEWQVLVTINKDDSTERFTATLWYGH
jgi:hypothetical protein